MKNKYHRSHRNRFCRKAAEYGVAWKRAGRRVDASLITSEAVDRINEFYVELYEAITSDNEIFCVDETPLDPEPYELYGWGVKGAVAPKVKVYHYLISIHINR